MDSKHSKLRERDAAKYLEYSRSWLRLKRMDGQTGGPPYYRIGKSIRYDTNDLDRWLDGHRVEP